MNDLTRRRGRAEENEITGAIVDSAFRIHQELGPGLLESAHEVILAHESRNRGFGVAVQPLVPIRYHGIESEAGFRADLVVEGCICVELKSLERLAPVHGKQLLTYLRLLNFRLGLINFGAPLIKDGIVRVINFSPLRVSATLREALQP